jgi:hypothetical protein
MAQLVNKFIKLTATSDGVNGQTVRAHYSSPVNYTPSEVSSEGTNKISAHLKGIDTALAGAGGETSNSFTIANNQASFANITPLLFTGPATAGVHVRYTIKRKTDAASKQETGVLLLTYDEFNGSWNYSAEGSGDSGVLFDINASGQVRYTSDNIAGANYSGSILFVYRQL